MPLAPRSLRRGQRRAAPKWAPEPPVAMPPGRIVHVPGRGELFLRDSGGDGAPLLLLHGWMFSADLNWFRSYRTLEEAGYRVLALDHRGHGRGLRTHVPFSLRECAADAAELLREVGVDRSLVAGYSMGGPIAQWMARDHADLVSGMVLCATSQEWRGPQMWAFWRTMAAIRFVLGLAPHEAWRRGFRWAGFPDSAETTWVTAELTRGSARDIAEAGRELGRFDSRPWIGSLTVPAAVVLTSRDTAVPPAKQRELAAALSAPIFEVEGDHAAVTVRAEEFNAGFLRALAAAGGVREAVAA